MLETLERTLTSGSRSASVRVLTCPADWDDPELRRGWAGLLSADDPNALYASPAWFDHVRSIRGADHLALAVAHAGGELVGCVPVRFGRHPLRFDAAGRALWTSTLRTAFVQGGVSAWPEGELPRLWPALFSARPGLDAV